MIWRAQVSYGDDSLLLIGQSKLPSGVDTSRVWLWGKGDDSSRVSTIAFVVGDERMAVAVSSNHVDRLGLTMLTHDSHSFFGLRVIAGQMRLSDGNVEKVLGERRLNMSVDDFRWVRQAVHFVLEASDLTLRRQRIDIISKALGGYRAGA